MKFKIILGNFTALLLLVVGSTVAENERNTENNLPPQTSRNSKETYSIAEIMPEQIITHQDIRDLNQQDEIQNSKQENKMEEDDDATDDDEEDNDISQSFIAVGSDFGSMAALVPANLTIIQSSRIGAKHVIGYVPINSPNGAALVFPAGGVRLVSTNNDNDDSDYDVETSRAVRKKNPNQWYNRGRRGQSSNRRKAYIYQRIPNNYYRRQWRPTAQTISSSQRRKGNKQRKRYRSRYPLYRSVVV